MNEEEEQSEDHDFEERTVQDLAISIQESKGKFAFLIGAGTSRAAGIPTSSDLMKWWKMYRYNQENPGVELEIDEVALENVPQNLGQIPDDIEDIPNEWLEEKNERREDQGKGEYEFWFEQARSGKGERRDFIQDMVENKEPSFGILILASLMADGYVPITLTPNFDDLLYDALYKYVEEKPMLINHDEIAPQLRMTRDRPKVVKLHGDYLFTNIQNTDEDLKENMREVISTTLAEYGLVVVGYGGEDKSIMDDALMRVTEDGKDMNLSEYGLYWCTRDKSNLSDRAKELLSDDDVDAYVVEIEGSEEMFNKLREKIDGFSMVSPKEITDRAEERADRLGRKSKEMKARVTGKEEESLEDLSGVWEVLQSGNQKYKHGEYEEAEEIYEKAIEIYSEDARVYNNYGVLLHKGLDRPDEAAEMYEKAIELNPEYADAYYNYGNLLREELDQPEEAAEKYRRAIEIDPGDAEVYRNYGILLYEELDRPEEAAEMYEKAIELNSEYAAAYNNYGLLLDKVEDLGEPEKAAEMYEKAIELDPEYAVAYNNYGNFLKNELDKLEEAAEMYEKAIEFDPEYAVAYNNYGILLREELNEPEEAAEMYEKAIETDPENAGAYYNYGNLLREELDQPKEAAEMYEKAIEIDPELAEAYHNYAILLDEGLENPERATEMYEKAIELDPEDAKAYYGYGNLLYKRLDRPDEAAEMYEKAIELDPELAEAYNNYGVLLHKGLDRPDEAAEMYEKAIELNPEYAEAYNNYGTLLFEELDEPGKAVEMYEKAIELDSEYNSAHQNRAEVHISLGEYENARSDAEKSLKLSDEIADRASSQMLLIIPKILLDEDISEEEEQFRNLCSEEFELTWSFEELNEWLSDADIDEKKKEKIGEIIDLLQEHKD